MIYGAIWTWFILTALAVGVSEMPNQDRGGHGQHGSGAAPAVGLMTLVSFGALGAGIVTAVIFINLQALTFGIHFVSGWMLQIPTMRQAFSDLVSRRIEIVAGGSRPMIRLAESATKQIFR
jgi:hypothetical protein